MIDVQVEAEPVDIIAIITHIIHRPSTINYANNDARRWRIRQEEILEKPREQIV